MELLCRRCSFNDQACDRIIPDFAEAGADYITFHPEASEHIDRTINLIKQSGCKPGIVLNPATSVHCLENCIDDVDMILLMSVNPGFAGQSFIEGTYKKIEQVRKLIDSVGKEIRLEVDGASQSITLQRLLTQEQIHLLLALQFSNLMTTQQPSKQ